MAASKFAEQSAARRRNLALVWSADASAATCLQLAPLAGWRLRGVPAEPHEAPASDLARYLARLPAGCELHVEHRIDPTHSTDAGYDCRLRLLGPHHIPAREAEAVGEALASLTPGFWFARDDSGSELAAGEWPLVAVLRPAPTRLWHERASPRGDPAESLPQEGPYPTLWPGRPLTLPLAERGASGRGIALVQRMRSFELDELAQTELHATMRRIQAGALRCYGASSPLSAFSADPALRQALIALMQLWLITPRGWCFDMELRARGDISGTAIERIGRHVFGHTPFDVLGPERAAFAPDLCRASLPAQGLPAIWPDAALARSLGAAVFYAAPATVLPTQGCVVGRTAAGPASAPVRLDPQARTRHAQVVGASGSGKTTLMLAMAAHEFADPDRPCGVNFITPHDPDAERVLDLLPAHCLPHLTLIDLADPTHTHCLNPLQGMRDDPVRAHRVASQFCDIVDMLFETSNSTGPMTRSNLKYLTLLAGLRPDRNGTLLDMVRAIEDARHRDWLIEHCPDPAVAGYWKRLIATNGENGYQNWLPYLQARLAPFTANPAFKRLLGRPESTIDFRRAMDERQFVVCNLGKSTMQDAECRAVGALLLMMIHEAALSRGGQDPARRLPFHLYVDEFQSFAGDSVGRLFAESRKFGLGLCVSTQQTAQLSNRWGRDSVLDAVLANTASKFVFRLGTPDVGTMSPYFSPAVSASEIARLPDFHAVATLPHGGHAGAPFVMQVTPPVPPPDAPGAAAAREYARAKATPIEQANEELVRLYGLHPGALS
jgi:hypothetical protein